MNFIVYLAFVLVISASFLGLWRMFRGPTVPDRVVAADTLVVISTAALVWLASEFDNPIFLDIALVYAALAFVGVVAIARAIEGSGSSK
jgi:multisubunit Na+/H+ antiporter MnhF subunit